jgi:hypothetical protein
MSDTKKSAGGAATPSAEITNNSTSIIEQAKAKIKVSDEKKLGRYEKAVNSATAAALCSFCEQSEEFARAVIDGKSYDECLKTSCKGIGQSISDFDLYTRAVQFYFPGAVIEYKMNIHMSEYELEEAPSAAAPKAEKTDISLSLDSLLDW